MNGGAREGDVVHTDIISKSCVSLVGSLSLADHKLPPQSESHTLSLIPSLPRRRRRRRAGNDATSH